MEHHAHMSFLIDKVDTMQKSRLQGTQHLPFSFERAKIHLQHSFRPRSEPRKAVPSLNVPTCAFFEINLIPGELKLKTLNMEHVVQRQSGDSFCDQLPCPIFQEKLTQSKRINFNRRLLIKIDFLGLRKGDPSLNHSFVPKNGGTTIWEKNRGIPSLLFQQGRPCVKVMVLHLGQAPFRNFHSPWRFFPRASERRVLPIVGVCLSFSHLLIFTSSHFTSSHLHIFSLHIFSSSHLLIFTSSRLHIFSSSHLLIFTSSHLHIFSSSHLLIFTSAHLHIFTSSHLLIFTSSHPHILTSSHPHIFTSSPLALLASCPLALFFTSSHPHIFTSSSHLHILTSSHLLLLPLLPSPSFLFLF